MRDLSIRSMVCGLTVLLALAGCSSGDDGGGDNTNPGIVPGAPNATGNTGAPGTTPPAPGAMTGDTGMTPSGDTGTTPATGNMDGTGMSMDAVTDPTMMGGAGADGSMTEPPPGGVDPSTGIDTTGFMAECVSGADNWGTEIQAGPCASGISRYGVKLQYGPYGARSEYNVGQGFENAVNAADNALACSIFIDAFGADPEGSADLKDLHDLDLSLYSVFYPGDMPEGEKYPLLSWGNGTCAMPEGYGALLRYVASHGYIVVAPNSRYVGSGAEQRRAIDFMFAANDDPSSKYYQRIDTTKVGAFGHSQGSGGTSNASMDSRVSTVILLNGSPNSSKPFLAISGDYDIVGNAPSTLANPVNASAHPAAYIWYQQVPFNVDGRPTGNTRGHLTLMMEPERVVEPVLAWFDMMLKDDAAAKQFFVGSDCTLCDGSSWPSMWASAEQLASEPSFVYGKNNNLQ